MWVKPWHPVKSKAPVLFWALWGQQGMSRESWAQNAGWASREFRSWCRSKKEWDLSTSAKYTAGLNCPGLAPVSRTQRSCSSTACSQSKPRWALARQEQPGEMQLMGAHKGKEDKQPKQEGNSLEHNPIYFNFISLTLPGGFQRMAQADFNLPVSGLIRNAHR